MKRIHKLWMMSLAAACLSGGCAGKSEIPVTAPAEPENTSSAVLGQPETGKTENIQAETAQIVKTAAAAAASIAATARESRSMTVEELISFEKFLGEEGAYGFLLSEYDSPGYIDINQVFYTGWGQADTPLSDEEKAVYLAREGGEIYTDLTRLTRQQIDDILTKRAGITLEDIKTRFYWTYVPEYDSYYFQHGDTNRVEFYCTQGTVQDGIYRVECRSRREQTVVYASTASVKRTSDGWQFLSNRITVDDMYVRENQAPVDFMPGVRHAVENYRKSRGLLGSGYGTAIFDSQLRYYTRKELEELDSKLYPIFRNEIYARHGYIFNSSEWNNFFDDYVWYEGRYKNSEFDAGCFNSFEDANRKLVQELERGRR